MGLIATLYFFSVIGAILIASYLPLVTFPAIIISLLRRKNVKKSVAAALIVLLIVFVNNVNRNGRGPTEAEYFMRQLEVGSPVGVLSLMGYLYLLYWWATFLKRRENKSPLVEAEIKNVKYVLAKQKERLVRYRYRILTIVGLVVLSITMYGLIQPIYTEETYILTSESGRGMYNNSINIKEKGQDFFFGPASVKIYYQKYGHPSYSITEVVDNGGEPLKRENFQVDWEDNENATVTITSEKSSPRTIKINVSERIPE